MINIKKLCILIYALLIVSAPDLHGQSRKVVLEKLLKNYTLKAPLQFSRTFNLYKNAHSKSITESYNGVFYKNSANDVYMKINTTEFYSNNMYVAQISPVEKMILVMKPSANIESNYDINKLLESYNQSSFKDKKTFWELELTAKPFSGLPYHKIIIEIGKDFFMKRQLFYYSAGVNFSNDYSKPNIDNPLLEIVYGKHTRYVPANHNFSPSKYFTLQNDKIKITEKYKKFQLIDKRR